MAPPTVNNAEPDVQFLRIQLEVARASRRQFVGTLSFRQGYVVARQAYFEKLASIIEGFRSGVAANPPTATRAQLADALTRKETDEVAFPDLTEDDVVSDVPSVVEPLIPPQLVTVGAPEANKDVFDPEGDRARGHSGFRHGLKVGQPQTGSSRQSTATKPSGGGPTTRQRPPHFRR